MPRSPARRRSFRRLGAAALLGALLAPTLGTTGCAYLGMVTEKRRARREFEEAPTLTSIYRLFSNDCYVVSGRLDRPAPFATPMAAVALLRRGNTWEVADYRMLFPGSDGWSLFLPAGSYRLLLLADLDGDGSFRQDEVVSAAPAEGTFDVVPPASPGVASIQGPSFRLRLRSPVRAEVPITLEARRHAPTVPSLSDPLFDPEVGELGLYHPDRWIERTQGVFFGLEPVDLDRDQVVFVHGILGTPRDFAFLVEGLDHDRYGAWFFYYPSGLPLDRTGAQLAVILGRLEELTRAGGHRVFLVAHSMGGLVARRALNEVCAKGKPPALAGYVSFVSPYGGVESAAASMKAPEIADSWRDLVPGSDFLSRLHRTPLPADLPFHLFFAWGTPERHGPGFAGDGTIALSSQLFAPAQGAAVRTHGYEQGHVGILHDPAARDRFLRLLDTVTP